MTSAAQAPLRSAAMGRRVWRIAGPIILSNMSVPLLGAVDTAVMGHLPGPHFIGAVALGALIFSYIYWGAGFLRMGTTGLTAQAFGAGDGEALRATLARAWLLAAAIALALLLFQGPILVLALTLIEGSAEVEGQTAIYYQVRIWAVPAALANYVALGWLIGVHRAAAMMALQIFMNGINIGLDLVFVMGLEWGVAGVAWASVIAEYAAAATGLWLILGGLDAVPGHWLRRRAFDLLQIRRMMAVNLDIFVRTICLVTAFAYFTAQAAKLDDVTLAANAVLMTLFTLMAFGLDGFAFAAEALVGQAVGARDAAALRAAVRLSTLWALGTAAVFSVAYLIAGTLVIAAITDIAAVRARAFAFLPWAVVAPLISVWSFQLDGIFIGATRTADMRNMMIVSLAVYLAAVWLLVPWLGNHGLWLAFLTFMATRGITLGLRYPALARIIATQ